MLPNGQHVAVKHIINDGQMDTFVREVTSLSHIRHPNLVALLGFCEHEDEYFLVYELCNNGNLSEWLYGRSSFPFMKCFSFTILITWGKLIDKFGEQQASIEFSHGFRDLRLQLTVLRGSGFSTLIQKAASFTAISRLVLPRRELHLLFHFFLFSLSVFNLFLGSQPTFS